MHANTRSDTRTSLTVVEISHSIASYEYLPRQHLYELASTLPLIMLAVLRQCKLNHAQSMLDTLRRIHQSIRCPQLASNLPMYERVLRTKEYRQLKRRVDNA